MSLRMCVSQIRRKIHKHLLESRQRYLHTRLLVHEDLAWCTQHWRAQRNLHSGKKKRDFLFFAHFNRHCCRDTVQGFSETLCDFLLCAFSALYPPQARSGLHPIRWQLRPPVHMVFFVFFLRPPLRVNKRTHASELFRARPPRPPLSLSLPYASISCATSLKKHGLSRDTGIIPLGSPGLLE